MDPFEHPDLIEVGRRMRIRIERVLAAESAAAAAASRREATLRDLITDLEDREIRAIITTGSGAATDGIVSLVGANFVQIAVGPTSVVIPLSRIETITFAN